MYVCMQAHGDTTPQPHTHVATSMYILNQQPTTGGSAHIKNVTTNNANEAWALACHCHNEHKRHPNKQIKRLYRNYMVSSVRLKHICAINSQTSVKSQAVNTQEYSSQHQCNADANINVYIVLHHPITEFFLHSAHTRSGWLMAVFNLQHQQNSHTAPVAA